MKRAIVFIGVLAFCALLAWVGGYNFDERNGLVAYCLLVAVGIAAWLAAWPRPDK